MLNHKIIKKDKFCNISNNIATSDINLNCNFSMNDDREYENDDDDDNSNGINTHSINDEITKNMNKKKQIRV